MRYKRGGHRRARAHAAAATARSLRSAALSGRAAAAADSAAAAAQPRPQRRAQPRQPARGRLLCALPLLQRVRVAAGGAAAVLGEAAAQPAAALAAAGAAEAAPARPELGAALEATAVLRVVRRAAAHWRCVRRRHAHCTAPTSTQPDLLSQSAERDREGLSDCSVVDCRAPQFVARWWACARGLPRRPWRSSRSAAPCAGCSPTMAQRRPAGCGNTGEPPNARGGRVPRLLPRRVPHLLAPRAHARAAWDRANVDFVVRPLAVLRWPDGELVCAACVVCVSVSVSACRTNAFVRPHGLSR